MVSCVQAGVFTDSLARRENFVTGIEARTKLAFTVLALAVNLLSPGIYAPIALAGLCLSVMLLVRLPLKTVLLRLAMPLVMAAVLLVTQLFLFGRSPLFTVSLLGVSLTGYEEGLARGVLVVARVLAGVSLVLLLSLTTPVDRLLRAAVWFRVPPVFIELSLLVYRYTFVLLEEFLTMQDAQRVRLGFHGWRRSLGSTAALGASGLLRAYDRAGRVFDAMRLRGYDGAISTRPQPFSARDSLTATCLLLALAGIYLVGRIAA